MSSIQTGALPPDALLRTVVTGPEIYADCFNVNLPRAVSLSQFIVAFFDSAVFRMERMILKQFLSSPSTQSDVQALAAGTGDHLAAWQVQQRNDTQILLAIPSGPVRSWLMVQDTATDRPQSRLYFGTALVPAATADGTPSELPAGYRHFTGAHRLYSRILLSQAARGLRKSPEDNAALSFE